MGLVSQAVDDDKRAKLRGDLAIGPTRSSTTGSSNIENASPFIEESNIGPIAVAHNGNLTNADHLRAEAVRPGQSDGGDTADDDRDPAERDPAGRLQGAAQLPHRGCCGSRDDGDESRPEQQQRGDHHHTQREPDPDRSRQVPPSP
jgi:hypothetical protein